MWRALRWKVTGNSQIPSDYFKYPIFLGYSWVELDFFNLVFNYVQSFTNVPDIPQNSNCFSNPELSETLSSFY